uniref:Uncharacterized protein n=1 Tax=Rhizophagus irregularis (strain DAOM 181602 / DAOM 197198 / MUCL 43194) TaxID=747089 RepID=U9U4J0_RHIID
MALAQHSDKAEGSMVKADEDGNETREIMRPLRFIIKRKIFRPSGKKLYCSSNFSNEMVILGKQTQIFQNLESILIGDLTIGEGLHHSFDDLGMEKFAFAVYMPRSESRQRNITIERGTNIMSIKDRSIFLVHDKIGTMGIVQEFYKMCDSLRSKSRIISWRYVNHKDSQLNRAFKVFKVQVY